jgi:HTH-type transcriptional regulator/antitoxin HigA
MTENTTFAPDWVSAPGDTILDLIEERNWTRQQLADHLGYSLRHVNQLVKGNVTLTENAAIRLTTILGASVEFWLTREAQYRKQAALLDSTVKRPAKNHA